MIVPAAGGGTRLRADVPKALYPVNGRPMLDWLLDLYRDSVAQFVVVASPAGHDTIAAHCAGRPERIAVRVQERATGMLDAILIAREDVARAQVEQAWITWCDQIAVHPGTVARLARESERHPAADLTFPTSIQRNPYIHLVRQDDGRITDILHRREGDAMPEEGESEMGLFALSRRACVDWLQEFSNDAGAGAATGERNFLPFIPWCSERGVVRTFPCEHPIEAVGINDAQDLARVSNYLAARSTRSATVSFQPNP